MVGTKWLVCLFLHVVVLNAVSAIANARLCSRRYQDVIKLNGNPLGKGSRAELVEEQARTTSAKSELHRSAANHSTYIGDQMPDGCEMILLILSCAPAGLDF